MVAAELRGQGLAPWALEAILGWALESVHCDGPTSDVTSPTPRLGVSLRNAGSSSSTARACRESCGDERRVRVDALTNFEPEMNAAVCDRRVGNRMDAARAHAGGEGEHLLLQLRLLLQG
jgi:hypothetical protein